MATYNEEVIINDNLQVNGSSDEVQVAVKAASTQTEALQQWQDNSGSMLSEIDEEGHLHVGDLDATIDALIESHNLDSSGKPKRGFHAKGSLTGILSSLVSWVVQELVLKGAGGISALHRALRVQATNENTGEMDPGADVRAGDFEVINSGGNSGTNNLKMSALVAKVNNQSEKYLDKAYGLKVEIVDDGTSNEVYAIHTDNGIVHFGDVLELEDSAVHSPLRVTPRSTAPSSPNTNDLYLDDGTNTESGEVGLRYYDGADWHDLTGGGGTSTVIVVEQAGGSNLAYQDHVYRDPSNGKWSKIDNDVTPIAYHTDKGIVVEPSGILSNEYGQIAIEGVVDGFSGLTLGSPLYASSSAGEYTQSHPSVSLDGVQRLISEIGRPLSSASILLSNKPAQYWIGDTLATDEFITIEHEADSQPYSRHVFAYFSGFDEGSIMESYSSSNQDTDIPLLSSPLKSNMIAWWELNEASGNRSDSHGSVDLTDINTVGSTTGKQDNAAEFVPANSERLETSDNAMDTGDIAFTFAGWFYLTSLAINSGLVGKWGSSNGTQDYVLYYNSSASRFTWVVQTGGSNNRIVEADNLGAPSINTWYFIVVDFDPVANQSSIAVNNGTPNTLGFTQAPDVGSGDFYIGFQNSTYAGMRADEIVRFNRLLTADEKTWLYNSGNGRSYANALTSFANMDISQGFQVSASKLVFKIRLLMKRVGSPSDTLVVSIQPDSSGNPSGVPISNGVSEHVDCSTLSTSYEWVDFVFLVPPSVSASTPYHIVLEGEYTNSEINHVVWGGDTSSPGYSNGVAKAYVDGSWTALGADMVFELIDAVAVTDTPSDIVNWESSEPGIAVIYGDENASDPSTKITFKNNFPVAVDLLACVVVQ